MAGSTAADIAALVGEPVRGNASPATLERTGADLIEAPEEASALNEYFIERQWSDGLPVIAPTESRVAAMLQHSRRGRRDAIAKLAPAYGAATVERIAANAVMAGCRPEYLPVLIAAVDALSAEEFHLQSIQATTNPAAVWLIVNGPIRERLAINGAGNCLGQGARANAAIGRAVRLILQNIGGAFPGAIDRSTQGQPGKYSFCCAENEAASPWEPLHIERGFDSARSTVTVVSATGTTNMTSGAKDPHDLLRVIARTMAMPTSLEYIYGGEPWLILSPEHAEILARSGLSKNEVKRQLWEQTQLAADALAAKDLARARNNRKGELGDITGETILSLAREPQDIGIIVAGAAGIHSVYLPVFGPSRSVTRCIE